MHIFCHSVLLLPMFYFLQVTKHVFHIMKVSFLETPYELHIQYVQDLLLKFIFNHMEPSGNHMYHLIYHLKLNIMPI
jgi:hypothetical protein